jgi:hypothetical protein
MPTQVQDIPRFNYNNDVKHADVYIFEGDVSIISSVSKSIMGLYHSPT